MKMVSRDDMKYVVKSRTGKLYLFKTEDEAIKCAEEKSTKTVPYTVYTEGKPVCTYINKKQCTYWDTIAAETFGTFPKKTEMLELYKDEEYRKIDLGDFRHTVDVVENKVRYCVYGAKYIKYKKSITTKFYCSMSVVFHKDGSIYKTENGRIVHRTASLISIPYRGLLDVLQKELTKLRPDIRQLIEDANIHNICGVFSRPTAFYKFNTYKMQASRRTETLYFGYYPKEIVDESKIIDTLAKRIRVPVTKTLRKKYNENILNMSIVKCLREMGFKDVNSYQKLVHVGRYFRTCNPENYKPFFRKLIAMRGENHAAKIIDDTNLRLIHDTFLVYPMVDESIAEYIIKNANSIEEMHDTFNRNTSSSVRKNKEIPYSKKEKERLNYVSKNGIQFITAKDSEDLAIVGASMGICVGGYADSAAEKRTTIIKMMKGDKYEACIEVIGWKLRQLKAKYNNPVSAEFKEDINEWLKHAKIDASECLDYDRIGDAQTNTMNYAHIRPEDYHPRTTRTLQIIKTEHLTYKYSKDWLRKETSRLFGPYDNDNDSDIESPKLLYHDAGFAAVDTDDLPF